MKNLITENNQVIDFSEINSENYTKECYKVNWFEMGINYNPEYFFALLVAGFSVEEARKEYKKDSKSSGDICMVFYSYRDEDGYLEVCKEVIDYRTGERTKIA
jgi:hypothetical protein